MQADATCLRDAEAYKARWGEYPAGYRRRTLAAHQPLTDAQRRALPLPQLLSASKL